MNGCGPRKPQGSTPFRKEVLQENILKVDRMGKGELVIRLERGEADLLKKKKKR